MQLLPNKGVRQEELSEQNFIELCAYIEDIFDIAKTIKTDDGVRYKLSRGINRMKWVDGGEIKIKRQPNALFRIEYSLDTFFSMVIIFVMFSAFSLFILGSWESALIKLIVPLSLAALFIAIYKITFSIFEFRISNAITNVTSTNLKFSNEHKEWLADPDICSACGYKGVKDLKTYPDCGILLG